VTLAVRGAFWTLPVTVSNALLGLGGGRVLDGFEVLAQRRANVLRTTLQPEPRCHPHHGTDALSVLAEVNRLAERELRIQMAEADVGAGKRLDQGALDGAKLIMAWP
jgi:hypothetical protein